MGGGLVIETPILIPSFSSKGFPEMRQVLEVMAEFITDAVLVSAYDIYYKQLSARSLSFPSVVFLDSGGYEARVEYDLAEAYGQEYKPKKWTQEMHFEVLRHWPKAIPRVVVTFDTPRRTSSLGDQIARAARLQSRFPGVSIELLVKPEHRDSSTVPFEDLIRRVDQLRPFVAIGITEKESGSSFLQRLENISRLRIAMDHADVSSPIHIFGSLDALTTPLYFLAGAEIFDGLTWLRFGYHDGTTVYSQNYSVIREVDWLRRETRDLITNMWKNNYYYLQGLRDRMATSADTQAFESFGQIAPHLRSAAEALDSPLRRR